MNAAVRAEHISKSYDNTVALDDVSFTVDEGEIFSLVGPNGAGKTTLVRTLTGTEPPDAGSVTILGQSPTRIDKERIGLLPQSFAPPERLTARELLTYYAGLYDDPRPVDDVLVDVGMETADETWYVNLSGGQQRRVCVGIALVNEPDILFLDEPTTGIDPAGRQSLWSLVTDLADDGTTVFLTTHYMKEAETLADRVALLDDGWIVATETPTALVDEHGGGTRLEVETTQTWTGLDGFHFDAEPTETGIVVHDVSPAQIGEIVTALDERGVEYDALSWTEPTLEDAYLNLTRGKSGERDATTGPVLASGDDR